MSYIKSKLVLAVIALAFVGGANAMADHFEGEYKVTCHAHNLRGQRFEASDYAYSRREARHLAYDLQREAVYQCQDRGSLVCVADGCRVRAVRPW